MMSIGSLNHHHHHHQLSNTSATTTTPCKTNIITISHLASRAVPPHPTEPLTPAEPSNSIITPPHQSHPIPSRPSHPISPIGTRRTAHHPYHFLHPSLHSTVRADPHSRRTHLTIRVLNIPTTSRRCQAPFPKSLKPLTPPPVIRLIRKVHPYIPRISLFRPNGKWH